MIIKLHGERRVIRLKNPKLIKIRTGFRKLLEKEWSKRKRELEVQDNILYQNFFHDKIIDEATFDIQSRKIQAQLAASKKLRRASITSCASCGDMEKDHVFVPQTREWYCEECLEFLEKKDYFEVMENWENFYKDIYE